MGCVVVVSVEVIAIVCDMRGYMYRTIIYNEEY